MAHRPPRRPTRLSSPYVLSQPNGSQASGLELEKEQGILSDGAWNEPPHHTLLPSFMDYRGLERAGVLEGMQPLGKMPPIKMMARSRQEPSRRSTQARSLGSLAPQEGISIVDGSPAPASARTVSQLVDENTQTPSPAGDLYLLEIPALREESVPTMAPFASMSTDPGPTIAELLSSHSVLPHGISYIGLGTPLAHAPPAQMPAVLGSPAQPGSPYQKAIALAARNGDTQTEQMLYQIHLQAPRDPQLAELLSMLTRSPKTYEERVAIDESIRAFKRRAYAESHNPLNLGAAIIKPTVSRVDNHMSQSPLKTKGPIMVPATSIDPLIDPALTQTTSAAIQSALLTSKPTPKITLRHIASPNIEGSESVAAPLLMKQSIEPPILSSRRSSSSSLSSVDESILQEPSSLTMQYAIPTPRSSRPY